MMTKTALITGASSGIGEQIAHLHAKTGGNLILVARTESKLVELKKLLEGKYNISVHVIVKDLSFPNASKEVYEETCDLDLKVDYLINNAGFGLLGMFEEIDLKKHHSMIQLNITAVTELTHYFIRDFKLRNTGKVLNVSSTASLVPGPLQAVYFATKAYVTSFSNALYEELSETQITVTNLMPGATETQFGKVSGMDKTDLFSSTASPLKVASDGYKGMLNGKLNVISGITFSQKILNLFMPFIPKKIILKQIKDMQSIRK